ncbi:hypothetical protein [Amylibacter sp. IMCC11727]|uniref:hypothetical protein n=1 Tax=Amylibacter sp. IMCC11727 TaxID=3039851 RepID=UPI00244D9D3E|nr:hypothetical protein [Amylibacter sp. IMCC11727]WGI20966.1 hypothetical protein QBD29_12715 [Amylibacter sp. IMCC11727]
MSQEWMIDVLQDLRKFAIRNQLTELAEQLDDTIHIAVTELVKKTPDRVAAEQNAESPRSVPRARGTL